MDTYIHLAKNTIERYIQYREIIDTPRDLPEEFYTRTAGVFVTIFSGSDLRGCIGTFLPTQNNIAEEIIQNAISACSRDYRFFPITSDELPNLRYEVSILSAPSKINDLSRHDPRKHGIIVQASEGRSGLLLPDLEGVDTTDQQIAISAEKGGIDLQKDNIELLEFTVEKHE